MQKCCIVHSVCSVLPGWGSLFSANQGYPTSSGKGPQSLFWAGSRTARLKINKKGYI